jgi:serine/threonine protein kinase
MEHHAYGGGKEIVEDEDRWKPQPPGRMSRMMSASDWLGHGTVDQHQHQDRYLDNESEPDLRSPYSEQPGQPDPWSLPTSPTSKPIGLSGNDNSNFIPDHITSHPLFSYHAASASNSYTASPPGQMHLLSTSAPSEMEDLPGPSTMPVSPGKDQIQIQAGPSVISPINEGHTSFWASRWAGVSENQGVVSGTTTATPTRSTKINETSLMEALSGVRQGDEPSVLNNSIQGGEPFSPASAFLSNFSSPTLSAAGTGGLRRGTSMKSEVGWGGKMGESSVGRVARQSSNERSQERNLSVSPQDRLGYPARFTPSHASGGGGGFAHGRSISPYRSFSLNQTASRMAAEELSSNVSTTSSAPDGKGAKILGYTLGKIIGRGGFSTVRQATHDETGELFSCKIVKRDDLSDTSGSLENFELELELWKSLPRHPRILPLLETYRDPDGYATYLISPYMAGGSLLDVVRRDGGSEETARKWFPGVVAAVQALHEGYEGFEEGGMLHGDLKLDNFLVGHDGSICVCDFGLAQKLGRADGESGKREDEERGRGRSEGKRVIIESRPASRDRSRAAGSRSRSRYRQMNPFGQDHGHPHQHQHGHQQHHTQSGFVEGRRGNVRHSPSPGGRWGEKMPSSKAFPSASLPYAPPEILSAPPSGPSLAQDIWALGIILHALLTSRLPFVDTFDPRLQMKILRGDWVVPTHLGSEWLECLLGCLEGDKHKRWSIKQLASSDALQGWQHVKSRSRSRSRARSMSRRRDDNTLSVSPQSETRSTSRGRDLRPPSVDRSRDRSREPRPPSIDRLGSRNSSQGSSRAPSVPRRPRSAYDTPPTSGTGGHGLTSVMEAGDDLALSMRRLAVEQNSRSRSRGRKEDQPGASSGRSASRQ